MSEVRAGIVIAANASAAAAAIDSVADSVDGATDALKKTQAGGKAAATALDGVGSKADDAAKAMRRTEGQAGGLWRVLVDGAALTAHAMQVLGGAWRAVSEASREAIAQSMRFREESDPTRKKFEEMSDGLDRLKARVGDVLVTTMVGFSAAVETAGGGVEKWLVSNRKLIASNIVEWTANLARLLINGVARGATIVTQAWDGWRAIFAIVEGSALKAFASILAGMAKMTDVTAIALLKIGAIDIADKVNEGTQALLGWSAQASKAGGDSDANLANTLSTIVSESAQATHNIDEMARAANNFVNAGEKAALVAIGKTTGGGKDPADTAEKQSGAFAASWTRATGKVARDYAEMWNKRASLDEQGAKQMQAQAEQTQRALTDKAQTFVGNTQQITAGIGEIWGAMLAQNARAVDIMDALYKQMIASIIQMVQRAVMAYAVEAAAASFAKHAALGPGIGLVLGAAAATTALGLVQGLMSNMATGGEVRGGINGRDSVLAALTPGEHVLNVGEASMLRRFMSSVSQPRTSSVNQSGMPVFASGGPVVATPNQRGSSNGGGLTINTSLSLLDAPSSRTQRRKLLLSLGRELEELVSDRLVLRNMAGARTV